MATRTATLLLSLASASCLTVGTVHRPHVARRVRRISCGWGPDPVWTDLTVAKIEDAAEGLKAITIEPPARCASALPVEYHQMLAVGPCPSSPQLT